MDWLIWLGSAISALGIIGILLSVLRVLMARRANLPDDELRERIRRILPLNVGALFLSMIGLAMVIVGIIL